MQLYTEKNIFSGRIVYEEKDLHLSLILPHRTHEKQMPDIEQNMQSNSASREEWMRYLHTNMYI